MVMIYSPVTASIGSGKASIHQLRKNSTKPTARAVQILPQVIFSPFTPFVPRQDRASRRTANSFVYRMEQNSPAVRLKFIRILSTTPMSTPQSRIAS